MTDSTLQSTGSSALGALQSIRDSIEQISRLFDNLTWTTARLDDSHEREAVCPIAAMGDELAKATLEQIASLIASTKQNIDVEAGHAVSEAARSHHQTMDAAEALIKALGHARNTRAATYRKTVEQALSDLECDLAAARDGYARGMLR